MFDKKYVKNFDYYIPILILILAVIGSIGIGVSMRTPTDGQYQSFLHLFSSINLRHASLHLIWFTIGVIVMTAVIAIDYKIFSEVSHYFYWFFILALIYVDISGFIAGGAQSWIDFGVFKFQPSEFTKIAVIISLARIISLKENGIKRFRDVLVMFAYVAIPLVLVVMQPDFGTAAVIFAIFSGMLYLSGISYKMIAASALASLAAIVVLWFAFFTDEQKSRIFAFLNPEADKMGAGYHVMQSIIAIGSGRLFGKDILGTNMMSQLDFIPAKHTDFIFSVTSEAFGLLLGTIIILCYIFLIIRTLMIANTARDTFGSMLAAGVASMIIFHVFVNIGMTMGMVPVTGIPLPFMSYGGSSMLTNLISYGLVINVGMRRQKTLF